MTMNENEKIQNLQKKIKMQEVEDISHQKAIRNQYNETQKLKSKIESQEMKILSQEKKIQNQEIEITRLGKDIKVIRKYHHIYVYLINMKLTVDHKMPPYSSNDSIVFHLRSH